MAKRNVNLGNLNKAQVAIRFAQNPLLNITAQALSKSMVTISTSGDITQMIPTATGVVGSPNPYLQRTVTCGVLKTDPLAQQLLNAVKNDSKLGTIEITTDATTLDKVILENSFFQNYDTQSYNGDEAAIGFTFTGFETINNGLFGA